jgi:hypothetical protein
MREEDVCESGLSFLGILFCLTEFSHLGASSSSSSSSSFVVSVSIFVFLRNQ